MSKSRRENRFKNLCFLSAMETGKASRKKGIEDEKLILVRKGTKTG